MTRGLLLLVSLAFSVPSHASDHPLAAPLEAAAASPHAATQLTLIYDDVHGLYGGDRFEVRERVLTHTHKARGDATPVQRQVTLSPVQLQTLAGMLHSLGLWEQRIPDAHSRPDESRTRLDITLQGQSASVWERHNDLEANDRLVQVRALLEGYLPAD